MSKPDQAPSAKDSEGNTRQFPRKVSNLKYTGFAILLAWHYALWFVPHSFAATQLLDDRVTVAWLANLVSTAIFLIIFAFALGRHRHLSNHKWLRFAAPMLICGGTIVLCIPSVTFASPAVTHSLAVFLGANEAIMWTLWGERFARIKARFTIGHIGTSFGLSLFLCVAIALALPPLVSPIFTAALPLISGALLIAAERFEAPNYPPLLVKNVAREGFKNMAVVCVISFVASAACYFLAAITPWEQLPGQDTSFTYGILFGALIMLAIAGICNIPKTKANIFKTYPWLLVLSIGALALFLADKALYYPAFIIAVGTSSIFEILLIMYFGILTSKGYSTPAIAFGLSGASIRLGIAAGNSLALVYELHPDIAFEFTPETCLVFICVLASLIIVLVHKEFDLITLMSDPMPQSQIETICDEVAREFGLSAREKEILTLIGRGYVTNNIADKLVISPYTVNTHIRHIYEKMDIHKRSELLNYLNMQRSDY